MYLYYSDFSRDENKSGWGVIGMISLELFSRFFMLTSHDVIPSLEPALLGGSNGEHIIFLWKNKKNSIIIIHQKLHYPCEIILILATDIAGLSKEYTIKCLSEKNKNVTPAKKISLFNKFQPINVT